MRPTSSDRFSRLRQVSALDLRARLERLERAASQLHSEEAITYRVRRAMDCYVASPVELGISGTYRARVNSGRLPFIDVRELWYPPSEKVGEGRFNRERQTKFYSSSRAHAALLEVRPQAGQRITLLYAKGRNHPIRSFLPLGLQTIQQPSWVARTSDLAPLMSALLREKELKKWTLINDAFARICTQIYDERSSPSLYRITNSILDVLKGVLFHGLLYPSIAAGHRAVNICMVPEVADETFEPAIGWMLDVGNHNQVRLVAVTRAIGADGSLIWEQLPPDTSPTIIENMAEELR